MVTLKLVLGLLATGWLGVLIARLEARRPIVELERAGATVIADFDGVVRSVSFCSPEADDRHAEFIAQLGSVTSVTLARSNVTAEGLRQLAVLPELRTLDISETPRADRSLAVVAQFPALRNLQMRRCGWLDDAELAAVDTESRVESMMLIGASVTDAGLKHLDRFPKVVQLGLDDCDAITDRGLRHVACLPRLQEVTVDRCDQVSPAGLACLARSESLQTLGARGIPIYRDEIRAMEIDPATLSFSVDEIIIPEVQPLLEMGARMGLDAHYEIEWVDLDDRADEYGADVPFTTVNSSDFTYERGLAAVEGPPVAISDDQLSRLRLTPEIKALFLRGIAITDAGLEELLPLTSLNWLVLDDVAITDDGLATLARLPTLEKLWLRHVSLSGEGLAHFSSSPQLSELVLYTDSLTDAGIAEVTRLSRLRTLVLGSSLPAEACRAVAELPQLQALAIVRSRLTTEDLRSLAVASQLRRLEFVETGFDAGSIVAIGQIPLLNSLHLERCRYERAELDRLLAQVPTLSVSGVRVEGDPATLISERQYLIRGVPQFGPAPPTAVH